jgi:hypothetical protein
MEGGRAVRAADGRGQRRLGRAAGPPAALAAALLLLLAGCGSGSLLDSLRTEKDALPLQLAPRESYVQVGRPIILTASGGIGPYAYRLDAGAGILEANDTEVTYIAPGAIAGHLLATRVLVLDQLAESAVAAVNVYALLAVSPAGSFALTGGESRGLAISGGVPEFTVTADSGSVERLDARTWRYTAQTAAGTSDTISIADQLGNQTSVTARVFAIGALVVDPAEALLYSGQSAVFTVTGGSGSYTVSQSPPEGVTTGSVQPLALSDGGTLTYTAPLPGSVAPGLTVTITVRDEVTAVEFRVDVSVFEPFALVFAPEPLENKIKVAPGGTISVTPSGGRQLYTFAVLSSLSSPGKIAEDPLGSGVWVYEAPAEKGKEVIVGSDDLGKAVSMNVDIKPF